ncbi:hypothetical protein CDAR_172411 [Caerostris darwini]|uniref:Uncharacterized protein n=1 Tax=Caerostris darwini TaxID=1538125 RepID=A0AAV4ME95_9ARAC|nr:hypothetical protein CDAR_172411 [Caerostris darwini]
MIVGDGILFRSRDSTPPGSVRARNAFGVRVHTRDRGWMDHLGEHQHFGARGKGGQETMRAQRIGLEAISSTFRTEKEGVMLSIVLQLYGSRHSATQRKGFLMLILSVFNNIVINKKR